MAEGFADFVPLVAPTIRPASERPPGAPGPPPNDAGYAAPPDGGPPLSPDQAWPQPGKPMTFGEFLHALNPLQHLPIIGPIYRAVTGETLSPPMQMAGAIVGGLITGGPIGVLATLGMTFVEEMFRLGPNNASPDGPQGGGAVSPSMAQSTVYTMFPGLGQTITLEAPTGATSPAAMAAYRAVNLANAA
jgi:hypothetical protein